MKWIKTSLLTLALALSFNVMAMIDDDEMIFKEALIQGDLKVVKQFIEPDAKVANEKFFGWAPLQMAANTNQIKVVKYLLSKGAEINYIHPNAKNTAFHLAALNGFKELSTLLEKNGADINIHLHQDVSLIRYFRDLGQTDMVEFLTKLGVKDNGCKTPSCF
jgi:ankyrin repeat protein